MLKQLHFLLKTVVKPSFIQKLWTIHVLLNLFKSNCLQKTWLFLHRNSKYDSKVIHWLAWNIHSCINWADNSTKNRQKMWLMNCILGKINWEELLIASPMELLQMQRNREPKVTGRRGWIVEFSCADSAIIAAIRPSHVRHSNWPSNGAEHSQMIAGDGKPTQLHIATIRDFPYATSSAFGRASTRYKFAIFGAAAFQIWWKIAFSPLLEDVSWTFSVFVGLFWIS